VVPRAASLLLTTMFSRWAERRLTGRMQNRPGLNRAGLFGLRRSYADGIKLALTEDIVPRRETTCCSGWARPSPRSQPGSAGIAPALHRARADRSAARGYRRNGQRSYAPPARTSRPAGRSSASESQPARHEHHIAGRSHREHHQD
jgi:hypothetical protein